MWNPIQKPFASWESNGPPTQIEDLLANGVPGIHIYALNKARSAIELIDAARPASP